MNFWRKIARLGVTDDMPIYMKKSTVFFNIAMRITVLVMVGIAAIMYYFLDLVYIPLGMIISIPFISISLVLNYKGKVRLSVFLISIFFPIYFTAMSIFAKSQGEGLTLIYSLTPRLGIILMAVIAFIVLGYSDLKRAFVGVGFNILVLSLFNQIHTWFGIDMKHLSIENSDVNVLIIALTNIFFFFIMMVYIQQKVNTEYEKIVIKQRDELSIKHAEIISQKEEIEAQRDEIKVQRDSVLEQKSKIEKQNKEITDSIIYASRIQQVALPSLDIVAKRFDLFVMFKPRDIVSGDFYWFKKVDNYSIIVTADCTGHGVPGAFVSLLGISFLNEIITEKHIIKSDKIINLLRNKIKLSLSQTGKDGEQKDGMDLSLYVIDESNLNLQFTGADNPIYILRKDFSGKDMEKYSDKKKFRVLTDNNISNYTLIELKPDRMPVGVYFAEREFSKTEFQLQKDDLIYSLSDGYIDQFGGEKGHKFMSKNFKNLLLSIADKPMKEQKIILEKTFDDWKQDLYQLDDVLVIGMKI